MDIDNKYKIPFHGKYHKGVDYCPFCDHEPESLHVDICGFNESHIGLLAVVECPVCFEKWSFHCRANDRHGGHYSYFLGTIESGLNKHFKD